MQASAIDKGSVLQGEYVLLDPIDDFEGRVFRATHLTSHRLVVVRLWRSEGQVAAPRVLETLKTASRIRHPALAALEAFGKQDDGTVFMVSEFVQGEPLDAWADKVGIPPLASIVDLLHRVCVGLNAAHRNGLAHDALNPRNVLVVQDDSAASPRLDGKLLDLGVPACMRPWPPRLGAAQFMAPEQLARALRANEAVLGADAAMNVYSCGCLLYYLCTGGAPIQGRNLEELSFAHAAGKLVPASKINPQISPALDEIILRALALAPGERFASVSELANALARVRPARNASGVRALATGVATALEIKPVRPDRRTTWDATFEERPTSETRLPLLPTRRVPLLPTTDRPPAIEPDRPRPSIPAATRAGAPDGKRASTPHAGRSSAPDAGRSSAPDAGRSSVPVGSFSGPLPSRPPPLSPLKSSSPPPIPRPRRAAVEQPAQIPISVLLAEPVAIERLELGAIVPEDEIPSGALMAYRGAPPRARARTGVRLSALLACALALGASAAGAYFMLRAPVVPAGDAIASGASARRTASDRTQAALQPESVQDGQSGKARLPGAVAIAGLRAAVEPAGEAAKDDAAQAAAALQSQAQATRVRALAGSKHAPATGARAPDRSRTVWRMQAALEQSDALARDGTAELDAAPTDAEDVRPEAPQELAAVDAQTNGSRPPPSRGAAAAPDDAVPASAPAVTREPVRSTRGAPRPSAKLAATPHIRELTVRGSLATSEVRRAVERIKPQLAACYARAAGAAGRNGFGELRMEVEIDERGRARAPRAQGGGLPGLDRCVAQAAVKLSGRPPDTGTVKAQWKVAFEP